MSLIVQRYGGTSVGSVERIRAVADKVLDYRARGHDVVVVLSAMSGETNRLIALAHDISTRPSPRELDVLVSTGEQVTIALLCMALQERGQDAQIGSASCREREERAAGGASRRDMKEGRLRAEPQY